jgi:hypothetical protein
MFRRKFNQEKNFGTKIYYNWSSRTGVVAVEVRGLRTY